MTRRKTRKSADMQKTQLPPEPVAAMFDPPGNVTINLVSPSGRLYVVAARVSFNIAPDDVDWFFHEWDWQYRQHLGLASEYKPKNQYHDKKVGYPPEPSKQAPTPLPVPELPMGADDDSVARGCQDDEVPCSLDQSAEESEPDKEPEPDTYESDIAEGDDAHATAAEMKEA